ncbi:MAG TPA: hypothetical protein VJ576_07565 [Rhodocyclaceae bacterium]|nr:hypothetical protein [Rhodocyclaceae bacterium]
MDRRTFITRLGASGFALTPVAATLSAALSACAKSGWPEGMAEIHWDRDTCTRCRMVISDRRFAAEARGGPKDDAFKFDDIGCAVFWLKDQPWAKDARLWVADAGSPSTAVAWLDARKAHYTTGKTSPMGYNYAAYSLPQAGSQEFGDMREHVLGKGK